MNDKIYVLHVAGRMDHGGTEALLMTLLRTLDHEHFQYDIVEQTDDICDYDEEILGLGSKIYRCPHISPLNIAHYRKWWRNFYNEHPEYQIIHGHSSGSARIYLDEANRAGRITIFHCHSNSYGKGISGFIRFIWQLPLRHLAKYNFACSSDSGISQFGKKGNFEIIKNGIQSEKYVWNLETRKKIRQNLGLTNEFVVGNVARIEDPKNHEFLVQIFAEIKKKCSDARLMLVGKGSKEPMIHELAKNLGVEDSVIYTGVRDDVNELLQAMDVFVLPSLYEGLGIANIEAQTAGLPTFTSAKVVPQEVKITNLLHFIPLEDTAEKWANDILANRITLSERRNTSIEIINAGFDIKTTSTRLNDFYKRCLHYEK